MLWNVNIVSFHWAWKIGFVRDIRKSFQIAFWAAPTTAQAVESTVELVLKAGFGTIHQLDGTARIGGAAIGESGTGGSGELGGLGV